MTGEFIRENASHDTVLVFLLEKAVTDVEGVVDLSGAYRILRASHTFVEG
jgi:hypothetical protein